MTKFKVTVQKSFHEEYEIELDAGGVMAAFDEVRKMTDKRNKASTDGSRYSVIKVETKEIK
jgi:hypothetical protein